MIYLELQDRKSMSDYSWIWLNKLVQSSNSWLELGSIEAFYLYAKLIFDRPLHADEQMSMRKLNSHTILQ